MKHLTLTSGLILLTLIAFTNCAPYTQPDTTESSSLADLTCDADCITPMPERLAIKPNLPGGTQYPVAIDLRDFNIAGDCNEAGFPSNTVMWELVLNGQVVRTSTQLKSSTKCINGRFEVYVKLIADPASDTVDRTGINGVPYTLRLSLLGQASANGQIVAKASQVITLLPQ